MFEVTTTLGMDRVTMSENRFTQYDDALYLVIGKESYDQCRIIIGTDGLYRYLIYKDHDGVVHEEKLGAYAPGDNM